MTLNKIIFPVCLLTMTLGFEFAKADFERGGGFQSRPGTQQGERRRGEGGREGFHDGGENGGRGWGHEGGEHGGGWEHDGGGPGDGGWGHEGGGHGRPMPFPGRPFPGSPYPGGPFPGTPYPGRPYPGGVYNPYPGTGGFNQMQPTIQIRRRVMNENIHLFALAGIDGRYNGYIVQSVTVVTRGGFPGSQLALVINGQMEMGTYASAGAMTLIPQYRAIIGQVNQLQLAVIGAFDIDYVVINLSRF